MSIHHRYASACTRLHHYFANIAEFILKAKMLFMANSRNFPYNANFLRERFQKMADLRRPYGRHLLHPVYIRVAMGWEKAKKVGFIFCLFYRGVVSLVMDLFVVESAGRADGGNRICDGFGAFVLGLGHFGDWQCFA